MLLITGIIVAVALACMMPHPAYADDAELAQLQAQIDQTAADYDQAADRVAQLQQQLQDNQDRIDEISGQLPEQQERSNDAVKALYLVQQEGFGLLNMVLSSQNLTEFLNAVDYIDCIQQHNAAQVTKLADMKADLEATKAQIETDERNASIAADSAAAALADAQAARQEAEERAIQQAAEQAANAAAVAAANAAAQGQDTQNKEASAPASSDSPSTAGQVEGTVSASDVNWSTSKTAFVNEWTGRINSYLSGSPMAGQGQVFAEAAWDSGVDPRWSPAIAYVESSLGEYCFKPHNAWGWGSSSWGSWEEAIRSQVSGLASGYGSTLTYAAAVKYCPPNADFWYNKCLAQMNSI